MKWILYCYTKHTFHCRLFGNKMLPQMPLSFLFSHIKPSVADLLLLNRVRAVGNRLKTINPASAAVYKNYSCVNYMRNNKNKCLVYNDNNVHSFIHPSGALLIVVSANVESNRIIHHYWRLIAHLGCCYESNTIIMFVQIGER